MAGPARLDRNLEELLMSLGDNQVFLRKKSPKLSKAMSFTLPPITSSAPSSLPPSALNHPVFSSEFSAHSIPIADPISVPASTIPSSTPFPINCSSIPTHQSYFSPGPKFTSSSSFLSDARPCSLHCSLNFPVTFFDRSWIASMISLKDFICHIISCRNRWAFGMGVPLKFFWSYFKPLRRLKTSHRRVDC